MEKAPGTTGSRKDIGKSSGKQKSSGQKRGGLRGWVRVKAAYGTEQFGPETVCEHCSTKAVGVMVKNTNVGIQGEPLCRRHRDKIKGEGSLAWEDRDFRRFVDV